MATLQLTLLGRLQIHRDDIDITSKLPKKARALLVYLAVTGQPQERVTLAGLLWSDYTETRARKNLRDVLSALRREVSPWLLLSGQTVGLTKTAVSHTDTYTFLNTIHNPTQQKQAIALYQGDFLNGFYIHKAMLFEEWVTSQREYLRQQVIVALQTAAKTCMAQQDITVALNYTQQLLQLDSWRESAHRLMMQLLAMNSEPSAALKQYEACSQILDTELGIEPSPETTQLYTDIRDGKFVFDSPPKQIINQQSIPHNLPPEQTHFIGRERELVQLDKYLEDEVTRLVTIVGTGGMGKTRLALALARQQVENGRFPDGVFFVPLASVTEAAMIGPAIAQAVNLHLETGSQRRPTEQQLQDFLQTKQILLVLDNFEHLTDNGNYPTNLLQAAPNVKIIITSRQRLNVSSEIPFIISGLNSPSLEAGKDTTVLANPHQYSAIQLFRQSARRVRPGYEIEANDLQVVARICHLVQGMPLGILLAAAWIDMLSLTEIAAEIEHNLDILETDLQDVPERQQSIRAIFDYSWNLLTQQEQELFSHLSVFRGGFTRKAAQEVAGISLHTLKSFMNKSLLQCNSDNGRYEIHELLRKYAEEQLAATGRGHTAHNEHLAYYAGMMRQLEESLTGRKHSLLVDTTQPKPGVSLIDPLTERELEVLQLVAIGQSNSEIARELVIAVSTVKSHTNKIFSKLDVNSRTQAIIKAKALGLLP